MSIKGVRLEFSDGTVFRAKSGVDVTFEGESLYAIDGFRTFTAIFNDHIDKGGSPGVADSNMGGVFAGFGAGIQRINIEFTQFEGSTDAWGDANSGDSANTKLQTLNRALTTKRMDSQNPGFLRTGEYEPNGKYDELPVAVYDWSFPLTTDDTSAFQGRITLYEAKDLNEAVDALSRVG